MTDAFTILGPSIGISKEIHSSKYRMVGESFRDAMSRVASSLKDDDEHYHLFRKLLLDMKFLPAGRVQSAMGSTKEVTPYNCLSGDTMVVTAEYGTVPIARLTDLEAHVINHKGEWTPATFKCFGEQKLHTVRFTAYKKTITVRSTADHRWISSEGKEITTENLKIKRQKLLGICPPSMDKSFEETEEYRKGLVHGFVFGDGTKTREGFNFRICSNHMVFGMILESLNIPSSTPPSYNKDPIYYFYGKNIWTDLKDFPESVSINYLRGFFRGWLAADGTVTTQPEVILTTHKKGLEFILEMGPIVGFNSIGNTLLTAQTNYGVRTRDTFNVRLDRNWLTKDDFIIPQQKKRFVSLNHTNWHVRQCYSSNVTEKVYCAIVPDGNSFMLDGGLITGNCFVSGTIEDNFTGEGGIMYQASKAVETMRMGGGIGYDFSSLRPRGEIITSLQSLASGPVSFLSIYDGCCRTIASAGHRRGAQMAVLRCDHPDIEEFVRAKQSHIRAPVLWDLVFSLPKDDPNRSKALEELQTTNELTGFNMSIAVTDEFMLAVERDGIFDLRWNEKVYKTIKARSLWEQIMRATWDWGEPGVIFIDTINKMNNLWYCETIYATNPCGEQPLPPHGACLLGSYNLTKFILSGKKKGQWEFDWKAFRESIPLVVRAMDNVIDRALYPLPEQEKEAKSKRRMGLGVTGLANAGEALGLPYASKEFLQFTSLVMETLTIGAYGASVDLAREKGAFPLFDKKKYLQGRFVAGLPSKLQERIRKYGIRNSHLISIAPTGTISLGADNISSGGEPVFDYMYDRKVLKFDGYVIETVEDYGYRVFGIKGKRAMDCSADDHVNVLLTLSRYVDSAVSKTCNVQPDMSWEDFKEIYFKAWRGGAKGCTTFNPKGKRSGVLTTTDTKLTACYVDAETGRKECE